MTSRPARVAVQEARLRGEDSPDTGASSPVDAELLTALRSDLDQGHQWTEQIAATVEEDYRQLMKDFGLR